MNNPTPAEQLQKLLLLSSTRDNPDQIKQVESYIQQNRLHEGFVPCLVQVITRNLPDLEGNSQCYHIVLASMVELKNVMRSHWHQFGNENCINHNDKEFFISKIIDLSYRLYNLPNQAMSYKFSKLMKDIIEITRCSSIKLYKQIASIIEQANTMQKFQRLPFCINILLGWSYQQFSSQAGHISAYTEMTRHIHPLLLDFIREGNNIIMDMYDKLTEISDKQEVVNFLKVYGQVKRKFQEILYLSIKLACKAVCFDGNQQYREIAFQWADVAMTKIRHSYVPEEYCEKNQGTGMGVKGKDLFNFYHGKKWALKFLNSFLERVLVIKLKDQAFNQLTINFYENNLETMLDIFREGWQIDQPKEIRYEQLRSFTNLVCCRHKYLSQNKSTEMQLYLSRILPNFIKLTEKQLEAIQDDPIEFIINQGQPTHYTASTKGIRMMATDLWLRISKLSEHLVVDEKNPMLAYSFSLIKSWTEHYSNDSNALILRDIGCYLLCKLPFQFQRIKSIQSDLVGLLDRIIRDNMMHPLHFMHIARALDLANAYSKILPQPLKEFMTLNIIQLYKNLQNNLIEPNSPQPTEIFILIKCCLALQKISYAIELSQPDLFLIIFTNLQLIKITSFEDIIKSVDSLLDRYITIVPGFALQLITHIKNWFRKYARAQTQERVDYRKSESFLVLANGVMDVLTTLTRLCETRDATIIRALDIQIANISGFVLQEKEEIVVEYKEGSINLMASYLFWYPTELPLTKTMYSLCKRHIIKMAGLQPHLLQRIEKRIQEIQITGPPQSLKMLKLYLSCQQTAGYDHQLYISFMRSYIKFIPFGQPIRPMPEISSNILSTTTNQTELFMYVVYQFFVYGNTSQYEDYMNTNTALVFLTLYYDYYQILKPHAQVHQSVNKFVIQVIQQGLNVQTVYPRISTYVVQLFCMWMVEVREEIFDFFNNWDAEKVKELFDNVFIHRNYYGLPEIIQNSQKARCVQGISVLIALAVKNQQLWKFISHRILELVKYAINFTEEILVPHKNSDKDLKRWKIDYQAYERKREEEMTMPEQNELNPPSSEAEKYMDFDAPMVLQPHFYNQDDYSSDEQDLFQALEYDQYVCPLLEQEQYQLHLLQSLYLLFKHNQSYYKNILNDTYAEKLQNIAYHNNLINNQQYSHFIELFDAYFGDFIEDDEDEDI